MPVPGAPSSAVADPEGMPPRSILSSSGTPNAMRMRSLASLPRRLVELDLGAGVDAIPWAVISDLVPAPQVVAAAELVHRQLAHRPGPDQAVAQLDDAVHHGVLGEGVARVLEGHQQRRAAEHGGERLQFVDELLDLLLPARRTGAGSPCRR